MIHNLRNAQPNELRAQTAKVLLNRLYRNLSELVADEVDLAKAESHALTAAAREFAVSMVCGVLALACLSVSAIVLLASTTSLWIAALIVAGIYAIVGATVRLIAREHFRRAADTMFSSLRALLNKPSDADLTLDERRARVEWTRGQVAQTMAALEQKTDLIAPLRDTVRDLSSMGVALIGIARSND
ncbi:MAG: phage holin family protein [Candidatus Aquilonibacter sp.]